MARCVGWRGGLLAGVLWGAWGGLPAAEGPEAPVELEEFRVESERRASVADRWATGTRTVEMEGLAQAGSGNLGEALSWEAGMSSSFYGAGASRPMVRGMGGYRVAVTADGLEAGDLSARSPDHAVAIEPRFLREVVVYRGAAALLHDGGAVGGAVDARTELLPAEELLAGGFVESGLSLSTVDEGTTGYVKAGHGTEPWEIRFHALHRETEDYAIPGSARTPAYDINNRLRLPPEVQGRVAPNPEGRVPNTWTETRLLSVGAGWWAAPFRARGHYQRYESRYGVPLDGHTHGNPFGAAGATGPGVGEGIRVELQQDRLYGETTLETEAGWIRPIRFRGALTSFAQEEWEGRFLSNDFDQDTVDMEVEVPLAGTDWALVQVGGYKEEQYENLNTTYDAGQPDEDFLRTSGRTFSWVGMGEYQPGDRTLRLAGRYERHRAEREDRRGLVRSDGAWSVVAEVEQLLLLGWEGRLSLARAARLPTPDERFIEAPHGATGVFQIPNPDLATETARTVEMSVERQAERWGVSLNLYYRDFDGFIFLENHGYEVGGLTAYTYAQKDVRFHGGEVEMRATLVKERGASLAAHAFIDWVEAEEVDSGEPLPRIPPLRAGGSLTARLNGWTANLDVLHAFAQKDVPRRVFGTLAYQSPTAHYTLVHVRVRHTREMFGGLARFEIGLSNLLDEEARQHTSFLKDVAPLPGRGAKVSLSLEF